MINITEEDLRRGLIKIQRQIDVLNELLEERELPLHVIKTIIKRKEKELKDLIEEIRNRK